MQYTPSIQHSLKSELKKSTKTKFTNEEDEKLKTLVELNGILDWTAIAKKMSPRTARQCRDRWCNYLNPNLSLQNWSKEEDQYLIMKFREIGPHWRILSNCFSNRSVNAVRNRTLKLTRQGFDYKYHHQMTKHVPCEMNEWSTMNKPTIINHNPSENLENCDFDVITKPDSEKLELFFTQVFEDSDFWTESYCLF